MQHDEKPYDLSQTPISFMSSITMETGEHGTRRVGNPGCGKGRRKGKRTEAEKKRESNRSDVAGSDR